VRSTEEEIPGFEVPMHETVVVERLKAPEDVADDLACQRWVEWTSKDLGHQFKGIAPLEIFNRKKQMIAFTASFQNSGQIRVDHLRLDPDLTVEELEALLVRCGIGQNLFDRTEPAGRLMNGLVDHAHAPTPQFPDDLVVSDAFPTDVLRPLTRSTGWAEVAAVGQFLGPSIGPCPTTEVSVTAETEERNLR